MGLATLAQRNPKRYTERTFSKLTIDQMRALEDKCTIMGLKPSEYIRGLIIRDLKCAAESGEANPDLSDQITVIGELVQALRLEHRTLSTVKPEEQKIAVAKQAEISAPAELAGYLARRRERKDLEKGLNTNAK